MRRQNPTTPRGRLLAAPVGEPDPVIVGLREHVSEVVAYVGEGRQRLGGVESMLGSLVMTYEIKSMTDWLILTQTRHLEEDGAANHYGLQRTSQLIAATTTISKASARATSALAVDMVRIPLADQALAEGRIGLEHVRVIRMAHRKLGPLDAAAEEALVDQAQLLANDELSEVVKRIIDSRTGDDSDTDEDEDGYRRRYLTITPRFGGYAVDGFLDQATGAWLMAGLAAHSGKRGSQDPRPLSQRQADALGEICRLAAGHKGAPAAARVTVTIDVNGAGTTATGGKLAGASLEATTCEADVTALLAILFPDGTLTPLDAGANTYRPSQRLRQAIAARDGTCIHHGCDKPPIHCHNHHIHHWSRGGKTTKINIALLCAYHHTQAHHGRFEILPHPDKPGQYQCVYPDQIPIPRTDRETARAGP